MIEGSMDIDIIQEFDQCGVRIFWKFAQVAMVGDMIDTDMEPPKGFKFFYKEDRYSADDIKTLPQEMAIIFLRLRLSDFVHGQTSTALLCKKYKSKLHKLEFHIMEDSLQIYTLYEVLNKIQEELAENSHKGHA